MMSRKLNITSQRTLHNLHHKQNSLNPSFLHQAIPLLGLLETDPLNPTQQSAHTHRKILLFPHFSLPRWHLTVGPEESKAPVSVDATSLCPESKSPAGGEESRLLSGGCGAKFVGRANRCCMGQRGGGVALCWWTGKCRLHPLSSVEAKLPDESTKFWKFKHDFSKTS